MRTQGVLRRPSGFTLLELMMVTAIVAILATLLLPVLHKAKGRGRQVECMGQLRQVGIAHQSFAHDHGSRFPFQTPIKEGGTLELVQAAPGLGEIQYGFRHFQALSNDLVDLRLLMCPADRRSNAVSFVGLRNEHISYFEAVTADAGHPDSVLSGDRNLVLRDGGNGAVLRISPGADVVWTREGHEFKGNLLFADGHVERKNTSGLQTTFRASSTPVSAWMPVGAGPSSLANRGGGSSGGSGSGSAGGGNGRGGSGGYGNGASGFTVVQSVVQSPSPTETAPASRVPESPASPAVALRSPARPASSLPAAPRPKLVADRATNAVAAIAAATESPSVAKVDAVPPRPETPANIFLVFVEPERCSWCWWLFLVVCVGAAVHLGMRIQRRKQAARLQPNLAGGPSPR